MGRKKVALVLHGYPAVLSNLKKADLINSCGND
ncbi:MAG: hypothetical protein UX91_C0007G0140 [Candidatus Amesbacteria bacterium GW2011_GWB1_47_19]|nr:MAG: hypothetical protein UW51_C0006G0051 [Candidatus Amesbacteria bacterium GW2011_GWA1_44_24]KKU31917.1 MAG: hypothetical protein UX46_C0002G0140 [Candidatus Amesbacteria bacterium GW2011_GWC1_46_24]KKU66853.1 MAG: hypothetical protein UX91_C0007G0140 [Candidatus Amesbacteria bacterium GW2011_GWB1_47_19]